MDNPRLTSRQWELLVVIDECCPPDPQAEGSRWQAVGFLGDDFWSNRLGYRVDFTGDGVMRAMRALKSRGLIRTEPVGNAAITEDGHLAVERGIEHGWIPLEVCDA